MKQLDQNPLVVRQEILTLGKISQSDLLVINNCKSSTTRLGFAYQLSFVNIRNYFPKQVPLEVVSDILRYVGYQLGLSVELIDGYQYNRAIIRQHQLKIKQYLSIKDYDAKIEEELIDYLLIQAHQTDHVSLLVPKAQCFLKSKNILQPALSTIRRLVGKCRDIARCDIESRLTKKLSQPVKEGLESLLIVMESRSILWHLKQPPGLPSAGNINVLMKKLKAIEDLGILHLDISWLNHNYKKLLAKRAHYYSVSRIKKMPENKRYSVLICLCRQLYEDTVDNIIEMLIKLIDRSEKLSNKQIDAATKKKRKTIKQVLMHFQTIGCLILNDDITDDKLRSKIYQSIPKNKLSDHVKTTGDWLNSKYGHVFHLLQNRYSYFRKFFPAFISRIELCNDGVLSSTELLKAIEVLKKLNSDENNQCPSDAPVEFIPPKIKDFIVDENGKIDRHGWEIALIQAVRDEIKHGNLSSKRSRFFCQFNNLFMPESQWKRERESFFNRAGLPPKAKHIEEYLTNRLHKAIDAFVEKEKSNTYAKVENEKWVLSVDEANQLSDADNSDLIKLRSFIKNNIRTIKLPDLLVEVDNDLHITNYFMSYENRKNRDKSAIVVVIAAWMAWGRLGGRPTQLNQRQINKLKRYYKKGELPINEICKVFGITKPTLYRYLKNNPDT